MNVRERLQMKAMLKQYNHEVVNRDIIGKILKNAEEKLSENRYLYKDADNTLDTTGTCEAYVIEYLYQLIGKITGINNMVLNFADGRMWVLAYDK